MTPEGKVAAYLKKRVKEIGGICRKISWEGRSDAPDYLVMCCGMSYFVEIKAPGESPRLSQVREFKRLRAYGGIQVFVVDSYAAVELMLRAFI